MSNPCWPKTILMVDPDYFDVTYAINEHMKDEFGQLQKIDHLLAQKQWNGLKQCYENLGAKVIVKKSNPCFPDMVFCANPFFTYLDSHRKLKVIFSKMNNTERSGEVDLWRSWFGEKGIEGISISGQFEGMGDALWEYESGRLFGGHGFRSKKETYQEVSHLAGVTPILLTLVDERFYHLDTCFSPLNKNVALYYPPAFDQLSNKILHDHFDHLIELTEPEAMNFAANCHCLDGKNVLIQSGDYTFTEKLNILGFELHYLDTSEFIKAGGSIFCLKHALFL